jgi:hypothetical protein
MDRGYQSRRGHSKIFGSLSVRLLWLPRTPTIYAIVEMYTNVEIYVATEIEFGSVI